MRKRSEKGAAFLIALGGLALISALAASALTLTTAPAARATAAIERAKAERTAEAAVHRIAVAFTRPEERAQAPRDGSVVATNFQEAALTISAQDALGLIDINLASRETLVRLLIATGTDPADAEIIAEAWTEGRPTNGRRGFTALEDVLSATPPGFESSAKAALTHATVWSGEPGVDPTTATAPALAAAADLPLNVAQSYVATRAFEGPLTPLPPEADLSSLRRSEGRVARLSVRVETEGGGRAALTVVIERTASPRIPIRFLSWR